MRKSTSKMLLGAALLAFCGSSASAAPIPALRGKEKAPLSRMRKAEPLHNWSNPDAMGQRQKRIAPEFTSPAGDTFQYVYAPDGSVWYAICDYDQDPIQHDYYTEYVLKGFTITFYDSNWNEIGKVRDVITLEGNELKCAQIELASQLTTRFFNNGADIEAMVSMSMNTPDFINNNRTKAYSIKNLAEGELSESIATVPGYPVDEVDCAKDKWSEDFYITFLSEEQPSDEGSYPHYLDFLAECYEVQTTYAKGLKEVMQNKTSLLKLPGDQMSSPMMLSNKVNGRLTLTYAEYEKSFFVDPTGQGGNESITDDNTLIIRTYQMNDAYPAEMELINTTKIQTIQNPQNSSDVICTFYGIGNLNWNKDVDFGNYTGDGRPAFVVSTDDYLISDDDHYNSGYYVYNADGQRIATIAENTFDYVMMSDLPGFEPQAMFVHTGDDMNFQFVDLYSCRTVTELDQLYRGHNLSVYTDRVLYGDSYAYASALSYGMALDDDVLGAPVIWIDTDGELIRLDVIPTGKGVQLAQVYVNKDALSPYVFNTDQDLEYMLLVKRSVPGLDSLREELLIASPQKGVINTFTAEEGKGAIRSVMLMAGADPQLLILYLDNDYRFTADSYSLPFDTALNGSGSISDPYLIASGGDLQMIKNAPAAYYRLVNDIDCAGLDYYPVDEFKGTLDGAGHTIKNICLVTRNNGKTGLFVSTNNATVKDLNFENPKMVLSGAYESGLIAATASKTSFQNIRVSGLSATGNSFGGEFGGLAGKSWVTTSFAGCEIAGADVNLPSSPCMGGIVGDIRTGTTVTGCAVKGSLTAGSTLGGIVGSTTTGDEVISQCHVDAVLKAENTVGGIVGFLDRSKVKNNYVEGSIEATKPSKWNHSISLGAIAGELEGDWDGKAGVSISQNLIGVSSFTYPSLEGVQAQDPRQLTTVHRVVGRTSYNAYLEEEPSKVIAETGVYNNYVVSDLPVVDPDYSNIEGTAIEPSLVDNDWLEKTLGFAFGDTPSAPWSSQSQYAYDPCLWFETSGGSSVEDITSSWSALSIINGTVTAEGCAITIFDINGKAVAAGYATVATASLSQGVYVAVATDNAGRTSTLKFAK